MKTNSDGTIATSPFWYQLSENEMALCGPTSAVMVNFSVAPGRVQNTSSETIDQVVDTLVQDVFGISDPAQFPGVSPQDMFNILIYLRDKYHKLHFQVVDSMEQIDRAVKSGYPCLFSCNEADISAWNKSTQQWVHAYTWMLSDGHVPGPVLGIEANTGNWLVTDPLNNRFQGYGPPYIYQRSGIAKSYSWGAIIQLTDWLAPIPDLNNWPANFNAQNLGSVATPTPQQRSTWLSTGQQQQASDVWAIGVQFVKSVFQADLLTSSGIKDAWNHEYMNGTNHGFPTTPERKTVNWNNAPIIVQYFASGARCEWDGSAHWYT